MREWLVMLMMSALAMTGCAHMTAQDQDFLLEQAVMRTVEGSGQPDQRAHQIHLAVLVVDGALAPGETLTSIRQEAFSWINAQAWSEADKSAMRYVVSRALAVADIEVGWPLDEALLQEIRHATDHVRTTLALLGYSFDG